jgi:electron transfer flavoprotein alpha subunit
MSDVLAVAEHRDGDLRDVSYELVSAGRDLAASLDGDLHLAIINGDVDAFASELNLAGVETIHTAANGSDFNHDVYTQVIQTLDVELEPAVVLLPNTVNGIDYAPAVANRLDLPLLTDSIDIEADDTLSVTREMYGSKVHTEIDLEPPVALTIRPGEWPAATDAGDASIEAVDVAIDETAVRSTVNGYEETGGDDVDITEAEMLVSIGRGIEDEENLDLIFDLADALDATVSSSRPIVDNGWLPKSRQVGQSGKSVTPEVYLAIGISGAVQHVAGMKDAETIIAVNTDPNAPIFDIADYGVVGDLFDVVPELIDEVA